MKTKCYLLFAIICFLTACSDKTNSEHLHLETDSCTNGGAVGLPRETMWVASENYLKVVLMVNEGDFEIYVAFDDDKDGVYENVEYSTGTLRIHNDTIVITEKGSGDSVSAILRGEIIFFYETDSTEAFTLYRKKI